VGEGVFSAIVVGTDGSQTATEAVRRAAELAKSCGARVHLVSAHKPMAWAQVSTGATVVPEVAQWALSPDAKVDAVLDEAAGLIRMNGVEVELHAPTGDPAEALIEVAEQQRADLVVVGNRGMESKKRFLLGAVPDKVSHHAPCSVLIVHTSA
jgi:nucleotide-binding universal stress UspA family protein